MRNIAITGNICLYMTVISTKLSIDVLKERCQGGKTLDACRLSIGGATFVKAVRCYATAVLSFAQAMRDFVTAMRNGVAAKYIKKREWMLETRD